MPVLHPVFDTHIYRRMDRRAAEELKALERSQSIQAIAGFYPTLELAAHLADPKDPAHNSSARGLSAVAAHTSVYDGSRSLVPLTRSLESQLAWGLFRHTPPGQREHAELFGYVLGEVASSDPPRVPDHLRDPLTLIKQSVQDREATFTKDMLGMVRHLDPKSTGWQPHSTDAASRARLLADLRTPEFLLSSAAARVQTTAELCEVILTPSDKAALANRILAAFPTSHAFMRNLLLGMVESGTDFSRPEKANSAWDMAMSYLVSPLASADGVPSLLVTDEKRFHTAAAGTGHESYCLTFKAYRSLLDERNAREYVDALPRLVA